MSMVGCFGDCAYGEGERPRSSPSGMNIVFHPPIQTVWRDKEPTKWYTDMVNSLAALGTNPNQLNQFGEAPLCIASYRAQGVIVEQLLQRENVNVNIQGKHGRTPLYLAAEEGHVYIVKLLLNHPEIDVNCRNSPRGATALMAACRRGHSRIVELLLQHPHIIPDLADNDGNNAFQQARTASVKCRLHSYSNRSRSLENVLPNRISAGNICHVSNSSSSSSSSLNSVGESTKRVPRRQYSIKSGDILEEEPLTKEANDEAAADSDTTGLPQLSLDVEDSGNFSEAQEEIAGAAYNPNQMTAQLTMEDELTPPVKEIPAEEKEGSDPSLLGSQKSGSVSPRSRFFRNFEPSNLIRTGLSGSKSSLSPDSPARSPLSALARAKHIFHFGDD